MTQVLVAIQKLLLVPLVTFALGRAFGLDPALAAVATLTMAIPTASTAYVMARVMGGDARLMAAMITIQHLAAVVSVPLWAVLLAR